MIHALPILAATRLLLLGHRHRRQDPAGDRRRPGLVLSPAGFAGCAATSVSPPSVAISDIESAGARRVLVHSLLFVASFSLIFILLGLTATQLGSLLNQHLEALRMAGGVLIVLMGIVFLATPFVDALNFQWHSDSLQRLAGRSLIGRGGPLIAGAAFAIAGPLARASLSARSSRRRQSPARLPMERCCLPSTPRAWRSHSC
jgi:hypothetical protein